MRLISFTPAAFEQFNEWKQINKPIQDRIIKLIVEISRNPFEGTGKPEALKHQLKGYWSRRIDDEHRLVYQVTDTQIIIIACKYHYTN
jgi:toxin YoeB